MHIYVGVRTCGAACMHQPCAAPKIELLQGREVAEALWQLNLNVQADDQHAAVCLYVRVRACGRMCECARVCVCACARGRARCCELN